MEPSQENPPEKRYFQFAGTLEKINDDELQSEELIIPSIGTVRLYLSRAYGYEPGDMGITFIDNKRVIDDAEELFQQGNLYQLDLIIIGPNKEITCFMHVGQDPQELSSILTFQEDANQEDPFKKFSAMPETWMFENNGEKYKLFAPADPNFIRNLKFRFELID